VDDWKDELIAFLNEVADKYETINYTHPDWFDLQELTPEKRVQVASLIREQREVRQ
jgi:hypothetical protein